VTVLLVAMFAGSFVSQRVIESFQLQPEHMRDSIWLQDWLALNGDAIASGHWWQFLTFGLLHESVFQLLGNLLLVYFAGREVEPIVGPRQTVGIFLAGNLVGAAVHWFSMPEFTLMGVSGGAAALLAAYATTLPELEVVGHLFFVLPLKLKAKYLGLSLAGISLACWFSQALPEVGPAAVFAGCVAGWAYARQLGFGNPFWFQRRIFERRQREARIARMPADQFMAEEVDPILEKIAANGVASLTRSERQILERGREKIAAKVR
jgi:membrane associated rhomboid family serine protease